MESGHIAFSAVIFLMPSSSCSLMKPIEQVVRDMLEREDPQFPQPLRTDADFRLLYLTGRMVHCKHSRLAPHKFPVACPGGTRV